jgi:hypothetical protein
VTEVPCDRPGEPSPTDPTFPSRVDAWVVVVPASALALLLHSGVTLLATSPTDGAIALSIAAALLAVMFLFSVPCRYTLARDHLLIQSGVIRLRIAYRDITDVRASGSPWSAPALSLRRVKVTFGRRFQLVSPRDRERFIDALQDRVARAVSDPP